MKTIQLASSFLALGLTLGMPTVAIAHVGHGDEFQAEGGINRVGVNAETDSVLGIVVEPIASPPDGDAGVYIPATALVDGADKQLVFVQYGEFYEPVPVTTGATQGELIEVTNGLSVGEKLVTQGSLSLYAESRKTQPTETAETAPASDPIVSPDPSHAQADAKGIPHQHDTAGNMASGTDGVGTSQRSGNPIVGILGGIGGLFVVSVAGILGLRAYNLSRKGKNFLGK